MPMPSTSRVLGGIALVAAIGGVAYVTYKHLTASGDSESKESSEESKSSAKTGISRRKKIKLQSLVEEFLSTRDISEAVACYKDIDDPAIGPELVKRAFRLAADRGERATEMMMKLLSSFEVRGLITPAALTAGLRVIVGRLPDTRLDVPNADLIAAEFLAHLILDDSIPEDFLVLLEPEAEGLVDITNRMLSGRHALALKKLRLMIKGMVRQYLVQGDMEGFDAAVMALDAPHYHHEVVKKMITLTLDEDGIMREQSSVLVARMVSSGIMKQDQVVEGFLRLYRQASDLKLDTPNIVDLIARYTARAISDGALPANFLKELPRSIVATPAEVDEAVSAQAEDEGTGVSTSPQKLKRSSVAGVRTVGATTVAEPVLPTLSPPRLIRNLSAHEDAPSHSASEEFGSSSAAWASAHATAAEIRDASAALLPARYEERPGAAAYRLKGIWGYKGPSLQELQASIDDIVAVFYRSDGGVESIATAEASVTALGGSRIIKPELVRRLCTHGVKLSGDDLESAKAAAAKSATLLESLAGKRFLMRADVRHGLQRVVELVDMESAPFDDPDVVAQPFLAHLIVLVVRDGLLSRSFFSRLPEHIVTTEPESSLQWLRFQVETELKLPKRSSSFTEKVVA